MLKTGKFYPLRHKLDNDNFTGRNGPEEVEGEVEVLERPQVVDGVREGSERVVGQIQVLQGGREGQEGAVRNGRQVVA